MTIYEAYQKEDTKHKVLRNNFGPLARRFFMSNPTKKKQFFNLQQACRKTRLFHFFRLFSILYEVVKYFIKTLTLCFQVEQEVWPGGLRSRLKLLHPAKREDSAAFECIATNEFGQNSTNINFVVQVSSLVYPRKTKYRWSFCDRTHPILSLQKLNFPPKKYYIFPKKVD